MAIPAEGRIVSVTETSPLRDEDDLFIEEYEYAGGGGGGGGGGCFRGLCFGWRGQGKYLLQRQEQDEEEEEEAVVGESWLRERGKRIKEFTEVVAGPKWKTFIRRLRVVMNNNKKRSKMQFQYDPQSYKLNFDDGEI